MTLRDFWSLSYFLREWTDRLFSVTDTTLLVLTATDTDGPQELHFSIPATHPSAQFVELRNERGASTTGRQVDVVLISQLDRDYTVSLTESDKTSVHLLMP